MDMRKQLALSIGQALDVEAEKIIGAIETPPNPDMGDFAFPCFRLAGSLKKPPGAIASLLVEKIQKPDFIDHIQVAGAYANFFLNKEGFARTVLQEVLNKKEAYGRQEMGAGRKIVIDYSSPNIAKPFHVGHLRSTVIGSALYHIFDFLGYECIGINHLGDWGTQFGKLIVAYKNWGCESAVEEKGIEELSRIYVKFHDEAEKNPDLNEEARGWLVKMQEGDEEALGYWKWFSQISMAEFNRIYNKLCISFDHMTGESFYNDKMGTVVSELREKDLLTESQGAMIVDLEEYKLAPCLILRRDGGTLYPTRDIAAAFYRKKTYDFHKTLYLTALDQSLHFAQFFAVIKRMGYPWAEDLVHVPFGLVSLAEGKLSTRKGQVVLMEELLEEAVKKTLDIIQAKNPALEGKEEIAEQVGIGAVIFNDLYNSRIKDVLFSWERMLNFDGETGPYVQYAHARASSVLAKAEALEASEPPERRERFLEWAAQNDKNIDYGVFTDEASFDVIKLLYSFPSKLEEAAAKYEPFVVTRHLVALSQSFNKFYHDNPILSSEAPVREARLVLTYCVKTVLKTGLGVLGIAAPEKM